MKPSPEPLIGKGSGAITVVAHPYFATVVAYLSFEFIRKDKINQYIK